MALPSYATKGELKTWVKVPALNTDFDTLMDLALSAASREIDKASNRSFVTTLSVAEARTYTAEWDSKKQRYVVEIDDLMSLTSLAVELDLDGSGDFTTDVTAADCVGFPYNASQKERPWTHLILPESTSASVRPGAVRITAKWGWTAVPDAVKQACLMQASRIFNRKDSPYGIAGSPQADGGGELRLLAYLDADVAVLLKSVKRLWGARSTGSWNSPVSYGWWGVGL